MGYKLSVEAEGDILKILLDGIHLFGLAQAERYHLGMEQVFEFLAAHPEAARERTEISPPVRVYPYGAHIVVYMIEQSGGIFILRVRHAREDWIDHPIA